MSEPSDGRHSAPWLHLAMNADNAREPMSETYDVQPPIGEGWDERVCMRCADEIEPDQESVTAPFAPDSKWVGDLHTWCALQDGLKLNWPSNRR